MTRHRLTIQEVMTANPITIEANAHLMTAYERMEENDVRRLPVVDRQGELEGIVTLSDVLRAIPQNTLLQLNGLPSADDWREMDASERAKQAKLRATARTKQVDDVMASDPITVYTNDTIQDAAERMLEYKVSGLPVIEGNKVVGIITESDVFRLVVEAWSEPEFTH